MSDIIEELSACARASDARGNRYVEVPSEMFDRLVAEIERLRSIAGKADVGQSFSDMTSELRHQTPAND